MISSIRSMACGFSIFDIRPTRPWAIADFREVFRALDERQGNPVDVVDCENGVEIGAVLVGKHACRQQGIGKADALAVGNGGAGNDLGDDRLAIACFSAQVQLTIVDQQAVSGLHRFQNFRMRQEDALVVAGRIVAVEREGLAWDERDLGVGEFSDAQLWSLQVGENADRPATAGFDGADARHQRAHHLMAGMAHVDAEQIGACFMELLDHRFVRRSGTECGEDFDVSIAFHQFWLSWLPGVSDN